MRFLASTRASSRSAALAEVAAISLPVDCTTSATIHPKAKSNKCLFRIIVLYMAEKSIIKCHHSL